MPNVNVNINNSSRSSLTKNAFKTNDLRSAHIAEKIKEYIDENITSTFTLEIIASKFDISTSYLSHTFKKNFNTSVFQYIKHQRLSLAIKYYNSGIRLSIAAEKAGFEEYRAFYLAYRNQFGISPSKNIKIK